MEITDEQRTVLQIKFEDGSKLYLNCGNYQAVANPRYGTRYAPIDPAHPNREKKMKQDENWMKGSFEAEISFVPYLEALKEYNQ